MPRTHGGVAGAVGPETADGTTRQAFRAIGFRWLQAFGAIRRRGTNRAVGEGVEAVQGPFTASTGYPQGPFVREIICVL